ncbi:hypothetical protein DFJ73DRAFT_902615 [Zopfochytrium polystomum]|nr:hypothetical protein DFJ73DRAFT_902615 [Zopfochytrium polystomum]
MEAEGNSSEERNKRSTRSFPLTSLIILIVWSVAISKFPSERNAPGVDPAGTDSLLRYAIMDLASSCFAIFLFVFDYTQNMTFVSLLHLIYNIITLRYGWQWFADANGGYSVVQYKQTFGTNGWLSIPPFLYRVAYFLLWYYLVVFCILAAFVVLALVFWTVTCSLPFFANTRTSSWSSWSTSTPPTPPAPADTAAATVRTEEDRRQMRTRLPPRRSDTVASSLTATANFVPVAGSIVDAAVGWFAIPVPAWRLKPAAARMRATSSSPADIEMGAVDADPAAVGAASSSSSSNDGEDNSTPFLTSTEADADAAAAAALNNGGDGDVSCPVCCEEFAASDLPVVDLEVCAHRYHKKCIAAWFDSGKTRCPMCRAVVVVALADKI